MATYIMLSTLTEDGATTLKKRPTRLQEVNKEIEGMGATIQSQYAVLGPYDFVTIIDAPDNETIARISVEMGSRGSVQVQTLASIPINKFVQGLK
jgi:uncharacterized protein with GYD domain